MNLIDKSTTHIGKSGAIQYFVFELNDILKSVIVLICRSK